MCVAAPGKVTEIKENTAVIDYNGNKVNANIGLCPAKIGDWVLVHAGMVIQILEEDDALAMKELFDELEEF